ncbi:MAG: AAA family ATPase [Methanobrevibacter sp.]|jgi:predicted AAA+ superfamily ATPase|nr:AAA family ATPase [Methanobrevibacter sp.]
MIFEDEINRYINSKQSEMGDKINNINDFNRRGEFYKIKNYLDDFLDGHEGHNFIVMPGLRGVGKTTILLQLYDYLLNNKNINYKNILYISMDQFVKNFNSDLLNLVDRFLEFNHNTSQVHLRKKIFIFVDECHFDKSWGLSGKIINDNTKNIFLICTGSSALELEINTDIARRISKQSIYPNNFKDYLFLKHNINTNHNFPKALENMLYYGDDEYISKAIDLEEKVQEQFFNLGNSPSIEFNKFLKSYGFASTLKFENKDAFDEINLIIENVIDRDINVIQSFNGKTKDTISRIILYLALAPPGAISNQKIANYLSISPKLVYDILNVLEKTQMIFSIKPYGTGGIVVKKPWNYYFLSPSLKAAINYDMGRFNLDNKKCLGALSETYVASSLYKMSKTRFRFMGLFYPVEKKACDFLLRTKLEEIVPVEVGIGNKTKSQLVKSINDYNGEYGVLISNRYDRIKQHKNIIYLPLLSFGFL